MEVEVEMVKELMWGGGTRPISFQRDRFLPYRTPVVAYYCWRVHTERKAQGRDACPFSLSHRWISGAESPDRRVSTNHGIVGLLAPGPSAVGHSCPSSGRGGQDRRRNVRRCDAATAPRTEATRKRSTRDVCGLVLCGVWFAPETRCQK